jgi:hypothetical protein
MSDDGLNYTPAAGMSTEVPNSSQEPETPPGNQPQHEIYDPPIQHDPIGQALLGLPVAVVTGIGEGVVEGAGILADVGKEVLAWGAGELGIGVGESVLESGHGGHAGGGTGASSASGDPDAGASGDGAADSGNSSDPQDGGMCVDPSQEEQANYSAE